MKEKRKGRRKRNTEEKLLRLGSSMWNTAWRARRLEKRGEGGGSLVQFCLLSLQGAEDPLGVMRAPSGESPGSWSQPLTRLNFCDPLSPSEP